MVDQTRVRSEIPRPKIFQFTSKHNMQNPSICPDRQISVCFGGFRLSVTCDRLQMDRLPSYNPSGTPDLYLGYYALWELLV